MIDDLIAYLVSDEEVFLVPNAANTAKVVAALAAAAPAGVEVTDQHRDYAIFAVQGPKAPEVLESLGLPTEMEYMAFADASLTVDGQDYPVRVPHRLHRREGFRDHPVVGGRRSGVGRAVRAGGCR